MTNPFPSRWLAASALGAASLCVPFIASAQTTAPEETVARQFEQALPNAPGKQFTTVIVTLSPGARALPHRHGQAFVYAYVLEGAVRSQLDGTPATVYATGQDWFEPPGAHHVLTENAGGTTARLLVVFVADAGAALKVPDSR